MALSSLPTGSGCCRAAAETELLCCMPYGAYILCNICRDSNGPFTLEPPQGRVAPCSAGPHMSTFAQCRISTVRATCSCMSQLCFKQCNLLINKNAHVVAVKRSPTRFCCGSGGQQLTTFVTVRRLITGSASPELCWAGYALMFRLQPRRQSQAHIPGTKSPPMC